MMSYNVALETVVYSKDGSGHSSVTHAVLPFNAKDDADNYIRTYDRTESPDMWVSILRTATRLY